MSPADTGDSGAGAPSIEFPCDDYPIKVIAVSDGELRSTVVEIVGRHDGTFLERSLERSLEGCQEARVEEQPSSKGNYTSIRLRIRATGESQLKALHEELMSHPLVKMVL